MTNQEPDAIPHSVLTKISIQIQSIRGWNTKLEHVRRVDQMFGGSRYVWEFTSGIQPLFEYELGVISKFKEIAANKGIDGDRVLQQLKFVEPLQLSEAERSK
jgi:hypothetical protein